MKQFTQLFILVILSATFHLSASNVQRADTIGKFNEVTDIELRIKNMLDTTQTVDTLKESFQDTVSTMLSDTLLEKTLVDDTVKGLNLQDSIIGPIVKDTLLIETKSDSLQIDSTLITQPEKKKTFTPKVIITSLDSLYSRKANGIIQLPDEPEPTFDSYFSLLSFRDTMIYDPLFLPVVFSGRIEDPDSSFVYSSKEKDKYQGVLISPESTFLPNLEEQAFVDKVRRDYFTENITDVKISRFTMNDVKQTASDTFVREKFNPFKELLSSETSFSLENPDIEGVKIDRVYWVKTGEHSLQFSQNYFSPNWHRGGTSNLNINSNQIINVNYQKDKVRFNNRLEWRLSIFSAPDDSLRSYKIGDDLIRYYGDFGLDAYKKTWSYSVNLEAKTQMLTSHLPNKDELRSAFMSPLYLNTGIGMKYNLDKKSKTVRHRRIRLAVSISPLSVNYKYVGNSDVNQERFGIPEGKKSIFDKGSTLTSNMTYDFTKYISWKSRIKYFTNYSKVEAEFENTLNVSLSQYFSTRLYLHLRYDDGVPSHPDYKYLQINEVVSFGLNFKW